MTDPAGPWSSCLGRLILIAVAFVLALGASAAVLAHRPWFNEQGSGDSATPFVLEDLAVSQVVYGGFHVPGRVDYYGLTAPDGFVADVQIVVPDVPACAPFRPVLIVIGAGLPGDPDLPDGFRPPSALESDKVGAVVIASETWGSFFEPFTGTSYATGPKWTGEVEAGRYLIAVYEPDGDTGTYGLSLGGSERPGGDPNFLAKIAPFESCNPPELPATPVAR